MGLEGAYAVRAGATKKVAVEGTTPTQAIATPISGTRSFAGVPVVTPSLVPVAPTYTTRAHGPTCATASPWTPRVTVSPTTPTEDAEKSLHGATGPKTRVGPRRLTSPLARTVPLAPRLEIPRLDVTRAGSAEKAVARAGSLVALVMRRAEVGLKLHGRPEGPSSVVDTPRGGVGLSRP